MLLGGAAVSLLLGSVAMFVLLIIVLIALIAVKLLASAFGPPPGRR
jgi:hypothetical protein